MPFSLARPFAEKIQSSLLEFHWIALQRVWEKKRSFQGTFNKSHGERSEDADSPVEFHSRHEKTFEKEQRVIHQVMSITIFQQQLI